LGFSLSAAQRDPRKVGWQVIGIALSERNQPRVTARAADGVPGFAREREVIDAVSAVSFREARPRHENSQVRVALLGERIDPRQPLLLLGFQLGKLRCQLVISAVAVFVLRHHLEHLDLHYTRQTVFDKVLVFPCVLGRQQLPTRGLDLGGQQLQAGEQLGLAIALLGEIGGTADLDPGATEQLGSGGTVLGGSRAFQASVHQSTCSSAGRARLRSSKSSQAFSRALAASWSSRHVGQMSSKR